MDPHTRAGRVPASAGPDVGAILRAAVEEAVRLLGADGGFIYLVDEADGGLRFAEDAGVTRDATDREWIRGLHLPPGRGLLGAAIAERRVVATDDYGADPSFAHTPAADRVVAEVGIRAMIAAPMLVGDRPLGALAVHRARPGTFDAAGHALIRALADHAATSLDNSRLIAELAREREEAARRTEVERTLRRLAARIAVLPDPGDMLVDLVEEARCLLDAAVSSVDLVEPIDGRWSWVAPPEAASATHDPTNFENREGPGPMPGIWGLAVREGRAVATGDYLADDSFVHHAIPDAMVARDGFSSVAAAPLLSEGDLLGVLGVMSPVPDAFGRDELDLLEALATLTATALGTTRRLSELRSSRAELARRADREHALHEIAARVSVIGEPDDTLQLVVAEAVRLLEADGARIDLLDASKRNLIWRFAAGDLAEADRLYLGSAGLRVGEGIAGRAVAEGRPARTGDFLTETRTSRRSNAVRYAKATGVRSVLSTPLTSDAGPLGALSVVSRRMHAFDDDDAEVLSALATHASIAIANSMLVAELGRSREELAHRAAGEQAIRELAAQVTAATEARVVLKSTVDAAVRVLGADGALIDLIDPADGTLGWAVDSGMADVPDAGWLREQRLRVGEGLSGRAVARRRVVGTDDYLVDRSFDHSTQADAFIAQAGIRAMLAAPLVGDEGPLGALEVYARRPGAFGAADRALAVALADQAAIAVTNARLIEDLERSRAELAASVETERALRAIASRIAALAEADDVLTRVVEEACRLLGSDGAHLTRMNDAGTAVVPVVVAGGMSARTAAWLRTQEFPIDEGINGLAAGRAAVVWTADYPADPRIPHEADDTAVARRLGLRGMAAAPLRAPGGDVIGTLAVSYRKPHAFTANDLDRLQGLADHAAIALANSVLYQRLSTSEARYRLLVEHSPDIVYQADADGTFTYMSESVERLLGWSPEEVVGRHFSWIIDQGSLAEAAARWAELQAEPGRTLSANLELIAKDGSLHRFEVSATSLERDGRFAGMHGSSRDLSDRDRLERELRRQAGELAAAEERTHLARELHDSVTQALFSMGLVIRSIEVLMAEDPARAAERLRTLSELQRDALAEIRSLIFELRPGSLAENGLVPALRTHVAAVEGRIGLPVVLDADEDLERLPFPVEDALYRIAQEALHNTVKHASARSVRIEVSRTADEARLAVEDDGVGFDPDTVADDHLGLAGMRARAERVGGRLVLVPRRRGTRVEVTVPIRAE